MTTSPVTLRVAIGDYPQTLPVKRGEVTSTLLKLDFVEMKPMHTAFKPMVRQHAYDVSELALVTYLQAKAYNKGLTLLPAAMLARFQHHTCLYNSDRSTLRPADLAGKRIGVRSYSQTTGVWIRGIIENDYGVNLSGVQWVTGCGDLWRRDAERSAAQERDPGSGRGCARLVRQARRHTGQPHGGHDRRAGTIAAGGNR